MIEETYGDAGFDKQTVSVPIWSNQTHIQFGRHLKPNHNREREV
jgi:hypothetical protein